MNNLVILYNPYYQSDVIEQHVQVLINKERVAFGQMGQVILIPLAFFMILFICA